jgi:hypothetical protein
MSLALAGRLQDFLARTRTGSCPTATTLDGLADNLVAVVCGAEGLIANMSPCGAFADFLLVHAGRLPWISADTARAMDQVVQFAQTNALALRLPNQNEAATLAFGVFAIAWMYLANGQNLGVDNIIPAVALQGHQIPTTTCSTGSSVLATLTTAQWTGPTSGIITPIPTATPQPQAPQCPDNVLSGFPTSLFGLSTVQFCNEVTKNPTTRLSWVVDSQGNNVLLLEAVKGTNGVTNDLVRRAEDYHDYKIFLTWKPGEGAGACSMGCKEAFAAIANSPCK